MRQTPPKSTLERSLFWSFMLVSMLVVLLSLPMYIPYFALPFSFGIITVKQAQMLIDDIRGPHAEDSASTGGEA